MLSPQGWTGLTCLALWKTTTKGLDPMPRSSLALDGRLHWASQTQLKKMDPSKFREFVEKKEFDLMNLSHYEHFTMAENLPISHPWSNPPSFHHWPLVWRQVGTGRVTHERHGKTAWNEGSEPCLAVALVFEPCLPKFAHVRKLAHMKKIRSDDLKATPVGGGLLQGSWKNVQLKLDYLPVLIGVEVRAVNQNNHPSTVQNPTSHYADWFIGILAMVCYSPLNHLGSWRLTDFKSHLFWLNWPVIW